MHKLALGAMSIVAVLVATACSGGLVFAKDTRVRIVSPRDLGTVSTPVHIRWTAEVTPALMYAVFVDALPIHPGQNLRSLAGARCAGIPSCVDVAWLNRHNVYVTNQPDVELDALPILGTPHGNPDMHTVTIVLVDPAWRRQGESAWTVTFAVSRVLPALTSDEKR
jgi:hypothetical protein